MDESRDKTVPETCAAAASSPDTNVPEISARADDAILGPVPVKMAEEGSARRISPLLKRLVTYVPLAAATACLLGFAWVAEAYFSGGQSPFRPMKSQESSERGEMLRTVQKMAEEIRVLKANVEAMRATQSPGAKDAGGREDLKTRLDAVRTETGAAITDLSGKVLQLQRDSAAKLSQVSERLDHIELQITAQHAASSVGDARVSAAAAPRKRSQSGRNDAFEPWLNPTAPGVPRTLGTLGSAASVSPSGENAHGEQIN